MTGRLFEIREFTLHDGPGVRTTVFLKGCPLRCPWCHNPEGWSFAREELWRRDGTSIQCGEDWTAENLADELARNADIFAQSGGGVTFSGGEPLAQADFVVEVAGILRGRGIHLALETSGHAAPETYRRVVSAMDFVYQDIKTADARVFEGLCGGDLSLVLGNVAWLGKSGVRHVFRTPVVRGVNDSPEARAAILAIAGDSPHEFLPFNPGGAAKRRMLSGPGGSGR